MMAGLRRSSIMEFRNMGFYSQRKNSKTGEEKEDKILSTPKRVPPKSCEVCGSQAVKLKQIYPGVFIWDCGKHGKSRKH